MGRRPLAPQLPGGVTPGPGLWHRSAMGTPVQIRPATLADRDRLVELLLDQYSDHALKPPLEDLVPAVDAMLARPELGAILAAEEGGVIVGLAVVSFVWTLEHGGLSGWLDELYVVPERRSAGMGSALLRAVYDCARGAGAVALDLEVEAGHERAARLYEREGFTPHARRHYMRRLDR